jgi:hypothetical protein
MCEMGVTLFWSVRRSDHGLTSLEWNVHRFFTDWEKRQSQRGMVSVRLPFRSAAPTQQLASCVPNTTLDCRGVNVVAVRSHTPPLPGDGHSLCYPSQRHIRPEFGRDTVVIWGYFPSPIHYKPKKHPAQTQWQISVLCVLNPKRWRQSNSVGALLGCARIQSRAWSGGMLKRACDSASSGGMLKRACDSAMFLCNAKKGLRFGRKQLVFNARASLYPCW